MSNGELSSPVIESGLYPDGHGLYCAAGGFYIDPHRPVDRAVITHGHADHARPGHGHVLTTPETARIMQVRLGSDAAKALVAIGFKVSGWTRTPKSITGVTCYSGEDNLGSFLQQSEILVCLLPLTKSTHGILNKDLFSRLPKGACIINAARGEHLVDEDLLAAFDANLIDYATLDVFHQEPLPDTHPFWEHPRVLITPHVASLIDPVSGGKAIARNLRLFIEGQHVPDLVDLEQGY